MIDPKLQGKTILVTGANHGIGEAAARAFAAQGANVCIGYYRPPCAFPQEELEEARRSGTGGVLLLRALQQQSAEPIVQEIRAAGGRAAAREADLSTRSSIAPLFDWCEEVFGPVDVLVNNHTCDSLDTFDPACVTTEGFGIHPADSSCIDEHFEVNTRSFALMMCEYVRRYLARGGRAGRIINTSTDAAHAHAAAVSYAASKHAIESYSRSAAAELGKYGITVNVVAPGPIQTGYITPEQETKISAGTPLGRVGRPEDVADVMVFLASEQAHWLTGQLLYVGGGWRMPQ